MTILVASDLGANDGERGGGVVKREDRVGVGGCTEVTAEIGGILIVPGDFDVLVVLPKAGATDSDDGTILDAGVWFDALKLKGLAVAGDLVSGVLNTKVDDWTGVPVVDETALDEAGMKALDVVAVVVELTGGAEKLKPGGLIPVVAGFVNKDACWLTLVGTLGTDC